MRILVIEDDPSTADYIARGLAQEGQTAEVARTGKDGLFLALSEQFDVIVTDRMLPAPDGLAIVRALPALLRRFQRIERTGPVIYNRNVRFRGIKEMSLSFRR